MAKSDTILVSLTWYLPLPLPEVVISSRPASRWIHSDALLPQTQESFRQATSTMRRRKKPHLKKTSTCLPEVSGLLLQVVIAHSFKIYACFSSRFPNLAWFSTEIATEHCWRMPDVDPACRDLKGTPGEIAWAKESRQTSKKVKIHDQPHRAFRQALQSRMLKTTMLRAQVQ